MPATPDEIVVRAPRLYSVSHLVISAALMNFSMYAAQTSLWFLTSAPFFAIPAVAYTIQSVTGKPAWRVGREGLMVMTDFGSYPTIPWTYIDKIFYEKEGGREFWGFAVRKAEQFIEKPHTFERIGLQHDLETNITSIRIPFSRIPLSVGDFIKMMQEFHPNIRIQYPFAVIEGENNK